MTDNTTDGSNPIPGADSGPLYSSAKERAEFEAEYRANWGFQFAKDVLGCYKDYTMERDFQEWQRTPRAAAKVGANVAANKLPPPELTWLFTHCRAIGMECKSDSGKWEHDIALFTTDLQAEIAALRARLAAGAPAETPQRAFDVFPDGEVYERAPAETPKPLTRWTFDGGVTAAISPDGQWVRYADIAAQPAPAPIAGDVEEDAMALVNVATGVMDRYGILEGMHEEVIQEFCESLDAAFSKSLAAMLANSSSGEAG